MWDWKGLAESVRRGWGDGYSSVNEITAVSEQTEHLEPCVNEC